MRLAGRLARAAETYICSTVVDPLAAIGAFIDTRPVDVQCVLDAVLDGLAPELTASMRGLGLAHMDAVLRESAAAADFLAGDLGATLAERGVPVAVHA